MLTDVFATKKLNGKESKEELKCRIDIHFRFRELIKQKNRIYPYICEDILRMQGSLETYLFLGIITEEQYYKFLNLLSLLEN